MINITSVDNSILVSKLQSYDNMGQPTIDVSLSVPGMIDMETRLSNLENNLFAMEKEQSDERILRLKHPGLQDLHDQYEIMMGLVKDESSET